MTKGGGPRSYAEALDQARALVGAGRVADPGEHFPYKAQRVAEVLEEDAPAGPNGPDDDSVRVTDHMSPEIADASRVYIEAQERLLREPGSAEAKRDHDAAAERLVAARRYHRRDRVDADGRPVHVINGVRPGQGG